MDKNFELSKLSNEQLLELYKKSEDYITISGTVPVNDAKASCLVTVPLENIKTFYRTTRVPLL